MPEGVAALRRLVTEEELAAEGERTGRALAPGAVMLLEGELGAGKTTFIKAVVRGLGAACPSRVTRRGPSLHGDHGSPEHR